MRAPAKRLSGCFRSPGSNPGLPAINRRQLQASLALCLPAYGALINPMPTLPDVPGCGAHGFILASLPAEAFRLPDEI